MFVYFTIKVEFIVHVIRMKWLEKKISHVLFEKWSKCFQQASREE